MQVLVLGAFRFGAADGTRPALAAGAQRLLAFLALHRERISRPATASALWPDATDDRASTNLRAALSRLDTSARDAVAAEQGTLALTPDVAVDLHDAQALAHELLVDGARAAGPDEIRALSHDLLPDWYDDWVAPDAAEWRQLRVAALETVAHRLAETGRFAHAMTAAVSAAHVEPLREDATAAVMRVHLAEGNRAEAVRELRRYRALVQRELGVEPTDALYELAGVAPAATRRRGDGHRGVPKWDEVRAVRARVADLEAGAPRGT